MDYIPVYEGEDSDDNTVKVSPGKIQRTGVKTAAVGKRAIPAPSKRRASSSSTSGASPWLRRALTDSSTRSAPRHQRHPCQARRRARDGVRSGTAQPGSTSACRAELGRGPWRCSVSHRGRRPLAALSVRRVAWRTSVCPRSSSRRSSASATCQIPSSCRAPTDGVVLERNAVDGQAFKAGDVLFRLADHSVVWVMADVAEGRHRRREARSDGQGDDARTSRSHVQGQVGGGLSAPDERDAHRARAHRAAQPRPRAAARHVRATWRLPRVPTKPWWRCP